jgi:hypothetical protein
LVSKVLGPEVVQALLECEGLPRLVPHPPGEMPEQRISSEP